MSLFTAAAKKYRPTTQKLYYLTEPCDNSIIAKYIRLEVSGDYLVLEGIEKNLHVSFVSSAFIAA